MEKDHVAEVENFLKQVVQENTDKDANEQKDLIAKWEKDQETDLKEHIQKFNIELKKSNILNRLNELEKQEEILTFFDKKQEIVNTYFSQGFLNEDPSFIPIEPEESQFKSKFERHFKPYQKYANRPEHTLRVSNNRKDVQESLNKIYFNNRQAQTNYDSKISSKK